jgi:predicted nucleic acid-binding protein
VGPVRRGVARDVHEMIADLGIELVAADARLAEGAATVRASSGLKLPDAFVVATALASERSGARDVEVMSFDRRVAQTYAALTQ